MGLRMQSSARAEGRKTHMPARANRQPADFTHNERLVYEALCQSATPRKAYDLLDGLQKFGLRAPMTIYRALDALIAKGRVRKVETLNAFIAVDSAKPQAILICKKCSQVTQIPLEGRHVTDVFSSVNVSLNDVLIEAFGECPKGCLEDTAAEPVD